MRRLPFQINWPVLLLIIALVAASAWLILEQFKLLPTSLQMGWPLVLLVPSALWGLLALLRRKPRQVLESTTALGLSLGLLLITAKILTPTLGSVLGITAIVIGAGLLVRGLLMNQQSI